MMIRLQYNLNTKFVKIEKKLLNKINNIYCKQEIQGNKIHFYFRIHCSLSLKVNFFSLN